MQNLNKFLANIEISAPKKALRDTYTLILEQHEMGYNIWSILSDLRIKTTRKTPEKRIFQNRRVIAQNIADILFETKADGMPWWQRIEWCSSSQDFHNFFELLSIPQEKWRSAQWLSRKASLQSEKGGINRYLEGLCMVLKERYGSIDGFAARMDGRLPFEKISSEPEAANLIDREIRRLRQSGDWIVNTRSNKPITFIEKEEVTKEKYYNENVVIKEVADYLQTGQTVVGNISHPLNFLCDKSRNVPDGMIRKVRDSLRENFQKYPWRSLCDVTIDLELLHSDELADRKKGEKQRIIGESTARNLIETRDRNWRERTFGFNSIEDWYKIVMLLGINYSQLRSCKWWIQGAKKKKEEGGIGINLDFLLYELIAEQFGTHSNFLEVLDAYLIEKQIYFNHFGIYKKPNDNLAIMESNFYESYKNNGSIVSALIDISLSDEEISELMGKEKMRANRNLTSCKVFAEKIFKFDGKTMPERIRELSTPVHFLRFFTLADVPKDLWRKVDIFYTYRNKDNIMCFTQIVNGIKQDPRWQGDYKKFLEFMGQTDKSYAQIVRDFKKPEHALDYFKSLGLKESQWSNYEWWSNYSQLPLEQGGVGKIMTGFPQAVRVEGRWPTWIKFMEWVKEEKIISHAERCRMCKTPKQFLKWFEEEGIPSDLWQNSNWLINISCLSPQEGGIASSKSYIHKTIMRDGRFESWDFFLSWMGIVVQQTWPVRVAKCRNANDFIALFNSLKIPKGLWRKASYFQKNGLITLHNNICKDLRFGNWTTFIACMNDRLPFDGITSQRQAEQLLKQEILRLRQSGKWIINDSESKMFPRITPEERQEITKQEYVEKNIVVKTVAKFMNSKENS